MDDFNENFKNRMQNGKLKGSKLILAEDVPKLSKMKFDIHYDYTK